MPADKIVNVIAFDTEVGKLGYDLDQGKSYFQYNPGFLDAGV